MYISGYRISRGAEACLQHLVTGMKMSAGCRATAYPRTREQGPGHIADVQLVLHRCLTFTARLRGWHDISMVSTNEGVYLAPCKAIHTFGMRASIDIVFLDRQLRLLKLHESLPPNRIALCITAYATLELPAGYCRRNPDFMLHVQRALSGGE